MNANERLLAVTMLVASGRIYPAFAAQVLGVSVADYGTQARDALDRYEQMVDSGEMAPNQEQETTI